MRGVARNNPLRIAFYDVTNGSRGHTIQMLHRSHATQLRMKGEAMK
jgi:hypothetical protein